MGVGKIDADISHSNMNIIEWNIWRNSENEMIIYERQ